MLVLSEMADEAKVLRELDTWQLAEALNECGSFGSDPAKHTYIEHLLAQRLAKLQSKASWGAGLIGFFGAILGAWLSVTLAPSFQNNNPPQNMSNCPQTTNEKHTSYSPKNTTKNKTANITSIEPTKPLTVIIPHIKGEKNQPKLSKDKKDSNVRTNP